MQATELVVLAGGLGTRLRPAVPDVPKVLAPIRGRPFLGYQLESWLGQGVTSLVFLLHHQAALVESFLDSERAAGRLGTCALHTIVEPRPLGTGGAVAHAVRERAVEGSFLVTNADTWLGSGIAQLRAARPPALATVRVEDAGRFGLVSTDEGGFVTAFHEKGAAAAGWINAGLYHMEAAHFAQWDGEPFSLERELLTRLAVNGRLATIRLATDFMDIGVPADYLRFCRWIESDRVNAL